MSALLSFSATLSKCRSKPIADYTPSENNELYCDVPGYYLARIENQASAILDLLKHIYDTLPTIANGAQPSLGIDYKKISNLSGSITAAASELDQSLPDELKVSVYIAESFTHLSQFSQYIPHMTSSSALTVVGYISALQQTIQASIDHFDSILKLIPQCRAHFKKPAVQNQNAVLVSAIIFQIEACLVDIKLMIAEPQVASNEQELENLNQITERLDNMTSSIFSAAYATKEDIIAAVEPWISAKPTYLEVLISIESLIETPDMFTKSLNNQIRLYQLVNEARYGFLLSSTKILLEAFDQLSSQKVEDQAIKKLAISQLYDIKFRIATSNQSNDIVLACSGLSALSEAVEGAEAMRWAADVMRLYLSVVPDVQSTVSIFGLFICKISSIIAAYVKHTTRVSDKIEEIIDRNPALFDHAAHTYLKYCTKLLKAVSEGTFNVLTVLASAGSLVHALELLVGKCTHKQTLQEIKPLVSEIGQPINEVVGWSMQLIKAILAENVLHCETKARIYNYRASQPISLALRQGLVYDLNSVVAALKKCDIEYDPNLPHLSNPCPFPVLPDQPNQIITLNRSLLRLSLEKTRVASESVPERIPYYLGEAATAAYLVSLYQASNSFNASITSVRTSLDVVWPMLDLKERHQAYINSLLNLIADSLDICYKLPDPTFDIEITDELRAMYRVSSRVESLSDTRLKEAGAIVVNTVKVSKGKQVELIEKWMKIAETPSLDYMSFLNSLHDIIESGDTDLMKLYEIFCRLTCSLALNFNDFQGMVENICEPMIALMDGIPGNHELQLYSAVCELKYMNEKSSVPSHVPLYVFTSLVISDKREDKLALIDSIHLLRATGSKPELEEHLKKCLTEVISGTLDETTVRTLKDKLYVPNPKPKEDPDILNYAYQVSELYGSLSEILLSKKNLPLKQEALVKGMSTAAEALFDTFCLTTKTTSDTMFNMLSSSYPILSSLDHSDIRTVSRTIDTIINVLESPSTYAPSNPLDAAKQNLLLTLIRSMVSVPKTLKEDVSKCLSLSRGFTKESLSQLFNKLEPSFSQPRPLRSILRLVSVVQSLSDDLTSLTDQIPDYLLSTKTDTPSDSLVPTLKELEALSNSDDPDRVLSLILKADAAARTLLSEITAFLEDSPVLIDSAKSLTSLMGTFLRSAKSKFPSFDRSLIPPIISLVNSLEMSAPEEVEDEIDEELRKASEAIALVSQKMTLQEFTGDSYLVEKAMAILNAGEVVMNEARKRGKGKKIVEAANELVVCAEVLPIVAEALGEGVQDSDFMAVAAARMIRTAVSGLLAQVGAEGGDRGIAMDNAVKKVKEVTGEVIEKYEKEARETIRDTLGKGKVGNIVVARLNAKNKLSQLEKALEEEELALFKWRREESKNLREGKQKTQSS